MKLKTVSHVINHNMRGRLFSGDELGARRDLPISDFALQPRGNALRALRLGIRETPFNDDVASQPTLEREGFVHEGEKETSSRGVEQEARASTPSP